MQANTFDPMKAYTDRNANRPAANLEISDAEIAKRSLALAATYGRNYADCQDVEAVLWAFTRAPDFGCSDWPLMDRVSGFFGRMFYVNNHKAGARKYAKHPLRAYTAKMTPTGNQLRRA